MTNIFASFSTLDLSYQRDRLCESAIIVGFDAVLKWSPQDYNASEFYEKNKKTLDCTRGAGYWLWKPYLILQQLKKMAPDDILVYCDAGRAEYYNYSLNIFPSKILSNTKNSKFGFFLGPLLFQHGSLAKWTKRDCLKLMSMDRQSIIDKPLIQATWSVWTPTSSAIKFLEEWLEFAQDERCLTDISNQLGDDNYSCFVDHRHDQSILTLLAYKWGADFIDFSGNKVLIFTFKYLRPGFRNKFLRRIDDSELFYRGSYMLAIFRAAFDILF